ncbi:MAG TPA: sugar phosphate nucleotidyltransferase [Lachnospiraceae bacterium]|jgi:NDP-sugar pyrophosphorylase family protein|nr:sugar phosphate nucleotidyltransferase [Lachnospiraceae bacterium]
MEKPVLVIMAAGMGSRYGGLKQIDPVDSVGNKIIDFSIYDAIRAGFQKVIFIIKKENEQDFRTCVGDIVKDSIQVEYVFQELSDIPKGCSIPEGRIKPWGTAHAILSCCNIINGPFAVINADDYYGREAFQVIYDYLANNEDDTHYRYAMVGYELGNTLTENGYVSRGVCTTDQNDFLTDIVERTQIVKTDRGAAYTEDGTNYADIATDSIVSMNLWGFTKSFLPEVGKSFEQFFEKTVPSNPLKAECYLPFVVDELLNADKATVKVLKSKDKWFGVTYQEDKPYVVASIAKLKEEGVYPEKLW